jgi:hypothetical protein
MLKLLAVLLISLSSIAQQIPQADKTRVDEFYRLSEEIQDKVWPDWSKTPTPLLLVTAESEFLFHHPQPPRDFKAVSDGMLARPRQFSPTLLATFPAFGPPAVIVIGEPQNTEAKTSTPWLFVVMHEHFHQLQYGQPGYYSAVERLSLSKGDKTGMWMLNYPFPYEMPEVVKAFGHLRDLLLQVLAEADQSKAKQLAVMYAKERKRVMGQLGPDDRKYWAFQLWQEGIARYTQVKAAEAAASYQPSAEYSKLTDYKSFSDYAAHARRDTLDELKRADLSSWKRTFIYSFGAAEGFLLDLLHPGWHSEYFKHPLTTDPLFDLK